VLAPRFDWRIAEPVDIPPGTIAAAAEMGLAPLAVEILAARGVMDAAAVRAFAAPDPRSGLLDPGLLPDAGQALERVRRARDRAEPVLVVGDFDADGLTGMALLARALRAIGLVVGTYVPDRLDEGHGLSLGAIAAARAAGASLLVTVDTGSTSNAEIGEAARLGIDTIVTDHHRVGAQLPPAVAVVNPHRADARYPDPRLAGSGIALKVAQLVAADLLGMDPGVVGARLADLAVIGTVADVAPLVGENRSIARLGLDRLRTAPRPGIAALLARAGIAPADVDLETIAYAIAPRLNAAGRVGEAKDAGDLLMTEDPAEATRLAEVLEAANRTRRDLLAAALGEAREAAEADRDRAIVMIEGPWPVGIIGLIAGRLADEMGRTAIVGARHGDAVRASARGDGRLDLAATLDRVSSLLVRHGGHRAAAGFEVTADGWPALKDAIEALAIVDAMPLATSVLNVDIALSAADVDHRLLAALRSLEPTGPGNPTPMIAIEGLVVTSVRSANGGHGQLVLRRGLDVIDGIAFGREDIASQLAVDDRVDVVARLGSRVFAGLETLQLDVRDIATSGGHRASDALAVAVRRASALPVTA
jgi:single-stranded-DNA-specific exonuclease